MEQLADSVRVVPWLDAPVPQCGEVGSVLSPWEPLPPRARALLVLEQAAGIHRDHARLDQARHRTTMEVMRWFCDPVRCATLTWAERLHCLADASVWGVPLAQGGKEILGRMKQDPVLQVMQRIQEHRGAIRG